MTRLPDQDHRRRAVRVFDENQLVVAGAGTGKTSLLVERLVNGLLTETFALDRTVAITFTEKAAAELRSRVAATIESVARATHPEQPVAPESRSEAARSLAYLTGELGLDPAVLFERTQPLLEGVDRARISTIHGFCVDILRRHPLAAKLPPQFNLGPALDLKPAAEDTWHDVLRRELGADAKDPSEDWAGALSDFGEGRLAELAMILAERPVLAEMVARGEGISADPMELLKPKVQEGLALLGHIEARFERKDEFAEHSELLTNAANAFLTGGPQGLRDWERAWGDEEPKYVRDLVVAAKGDIPKGQEPLAAKYQKDVQRFGRYLKRLATVHEEEAARALRVMASFARTWREDSLNQGRLSFDDLLLLTRDLLRDEPAVRAAERGRIDALLVDEFQDTDPLQYEILFFLAAAGADATPDPYALPLEAGKLFIVGDPKQSIYRFRGADMTAYDRARNRLEATDGVVLTLSANFRSGSDILTAVNRLFERWIGVDEEGVVAESAIEPAYDPITAPDGAESPGRVELWSLPEPKHQKVEITRAQEGRAIAADIADRVRAKENTFRDFAILFRAMTQVSHYTRALRAAGIPFVVHGGKSFHLRPEVVEAMAWLRALANPADEVATLGALRSTVGAVTDPEILAYRNDGGGMSWGWEQEDKEQAHPAVARVFRMLRALRKETRAMPVDHRLRRVLTQGDLPLAMAPYFQGAQRVANLERLAERGAALARDRGLTFEATLQTLETEYLGEGIEEESPLADEGLDAVRLYSIHMAKGLEYPVVFLPDLSRNDMTFSDGYRTEATVHRTGDTERVALFLGSPNTARVLYGEDERAHEDAENKRIYYVAATRARERLVLICRKGKNKLVRALAAWGYSPPGEEAECPDGPLADAPVHHRAVDPDVQPVALDADLSPDLDPAITRFEAARANAKDLGEADPPFRTPSQGHDAPKPGEVPNDADADSDTTRPAAVRPELAPAIGTAVHRALEEDAPEAMREAGEREARLEAQRRGLDPKEVIAGMRAVLDAFLASPLAKRLAEIEILGREVPMLLDDEGTTVHGSIDLVYRHEGRVVVADFKSDALDGPIAAATYRGQLTDYGRAVQGALGLEELPWLEVWFLRTGAREVL